MRKDKREHCVAALEGRPGVEQNRVDQRRRRMVEEERRVIGSSGESKRMEREFQSLLCLTHP